MIKLTELIHSMDSENKEGLINIDDWKWPDVDHLVSMGFEFADDNKLTTNKPPIITIYKKKDKNEKNEQAEFFFIEEKDREKKRFVAFNDVIEYFDHYSQPEIDKNS